MDTPIDFKTAAKHHIRSYFTVLNEDRDSDILKANELLVFEKAESKLVVNAYGTGILDYESNSFNGCYTTNSIYFWKDPIQHFMEIHRVLKPGKKLTLAFIEKNAGEKLPWTLPDFTFYTIEQVKQLFKKAGFINIQVRQHSDNRNKQRYRSAIPIVIISGQKQILSSATGC